MKRGDLLRPRCPCWDGKTVMPVVYDDGPSPPQLTRLQSVAVPAPHPRGCSARSHLANVDYPF